MRRFDKPSIIGTSEFRKKFYATKFLTEQRFELFRLNVCAVVRRIAVFPKSFNF